jgi:hypothetical protein
MKQHLDPRRARFREDQQRSDQRAADQRLRQPHRRPGRAQQIGGRRIEEHAAHAPQRELQRRPSLRRRQRRREEQHQAERGDRAVRERRPLDPLEQVTVARPPSCDQRQAPGCQRRIEKQLDARELQRPDPGQRLELLEREQRRQNQQRRAPERPQSLGGTRPRHQARS